MTLTTQPAQLSRRTFLRTSTLAAGAVPALAWLAACGSDSKGGGKGGKTAFNFNLGFVPNGRNSPFYYGRELGLYSDRGLDVKIAPASGTGAALQLLSAGKADSAILSASAMLKLMGQTPDPAMKSYATIYTKNLSTIFFVKGKGIETPKDLEGKTIATSAGSNERLLFPAFAAANGIDADKVHWKTVDPSVKTGLILTGTVDATSTTLYGLAQLKNKAKPGEEIGYFTYGDHGVAGDVTVIGATVDYAEKQHATAMKAFVEGSMEAFKRALADPDAAVEAMHKAVPTLNVKTAKDEMSILRGVAIGPEQQQHGLGWNAPDDFKATADLVTRYFGVTLGKPSDAYFSNAYVGTVKP